MKTMYYNKVCMSPLGCKLSFYMAHSLKRSVNRSYS
uniref:Uncharacterized protein n=1 Tax=Rhizophora mucronata TaxID=61149 RepID=A0A2P2NBV7_RHIMU